MQNLPWILAFVAAAVLAAAFGAWGWKSGRRRRSAALPTDWDLSARPVFSADERRIYQSLRDALPHHVLLSKLPLVRFCQPIDPGEVRYWYGLLGNIHVSFAVCSPNGRVLAAIDLDSDRSQSRRAAQIKQSVLSACRVRYLRCAADHLPSIAELQLLVPSGVASANSPQPGVAPPAARPVEPVHTPRGQRSALWQDSTVFQDSFFSPDSRGNSGFTPLRSAPSPALRTGASEPDDGFDDDRSHPTELRRPRGVGRQDGRRDRDDVDPHGDPLFGEPDLSLGSRR